MLVIPEAKQKKYTGRVLMPPRRTGHWGRSGHCPKGLRTKNTPGVGVFLVQAAPKVDIRSSADSGGASRSSSVSASGPCGASQSSRALEILDSVGGLTLSSAPDKTTSPMSPTYVAGLILLA